MGGQRSPLSASMPVATPAVRSRAWTVREGSTQSREASVLDAPVPLLQRSMSTSMRAPGMSDDLGPSPRRRIRRERDSIARPHLEREAPRLFLEGLQAEAIGHVGADVGEMPDLGLASFDREAGMDLP